MKVVRRVLLTGLLLFVCVFSFGQFKQFNVYAGPGIMTYNGDLRESFLPDPRVMHFSYALGLGYRINHRLMVDYRYSSGKVSGNDAYATATWRQERGFLFESNIKEHSLRFSFDYLRFGKNIMIQSSLFAGIGVFSYNPMIEVNGSMVEARSIGTEGQYLNGPYEAPYGKYALSIPFGATGLIALNEFWDLKGEFTYHKTFTDHLDDVSGMYPYMQHVENASDPSLLLAATHKSDSPYPGGALRGNPDLKDAFFSFTISLVYKFGNGVQSVKERNASRYGCPSY